MTKMLVTNSTHSPEWIGNALVPPGGTTLCDVDKVPPLFLASAVPVAVPRASASAVTGRVGDSDTAPTIIIDSAPPDDGDGMPDGTIYMQVP